jgi:hypothetical protein
MAAPLHSIAQIRKGVTRKDKGIKISAGEGRYHGHIKLKGVNVNILDVKISGMIQMATWLYLRKHPCPPAGERLYIFIIIKMKYFLS